jgi:hypothetical protein
MAAGARGTARTSTADQQTAPITPRSRMSSPSRPIVASRAASASLAFPLFVGSVHWIIVQLTASLAYRYGTLTHTSAPFNNNGRLPLGPGALPLYGVTGFIVSPMRLWDGLWYQLIAEKGYKYSEWNSAFWPLFPWTMRYLGRWLDTSTALVGYVVANVCFFVALVLLYRLVALDFDVQVARVTVWAIALFPTALFFTAVYTESPFLMLLVGSLYAARRKHWFLAGLVGALAALTRSYGVFLVLPLGVLFLQDRGIYLRRLIPAGFSIALPVLGPAIFSWRLNKIWDDPWAWKNVQYQWNRYSAMPWDTLRWAFSQSPKGAEIGIRDGAEWGWLHQLVSHPSWSLFTSEPWRNAVANSDTLELVCTLLFIALAIIGIALLPLYQSVYLWPGLIVPLFQPSSVHELMSMPRFGLTLFPLFVVIALLLRGRRWLSLPLAILSTAGLVLLTIQFSTWYWVS